MIAEAAVDAVERLLKAAGDRTRLRILALLRKEPLCVCQLVEILGLSQPTVSKHLSVLASAGLVTDRKEGRWVFYSLARAAGKPAGGLLKWLAAVLPSSPVVQRDDRILKEKRLDGFRVACPTRRSAKVHPSR